MFPFHRWLLFWLVLLASPHLFATEEGAAIHIALIHANESGGDLSNAANIQGLRLYLDEFNRKGGINGLPVVIDQYNDLESSETAVAVAQQIVADGRAMAVIGHDYSSTSIAAGPVYAAAGIPIVTYSATNVRVTPGNDWFFRTIFNDATQGSYLANYAVRTLEQKRVTIIQETLTYGKYLGEVFADNANRLGATVDAIHIIDPAAGDREQRLTAIAEAIIAKGEDAGLIFLSLHAEEAIAIVTALRDAGSKQPLMGPDTVASASFTDAFSDLPQEQRQPGYYSDGIYITAPINFDAANEEAQRFLEQYRQRYGEKPDWNGAYAYDTLKVITEAMRSAKVSGDQGKLVEERSQVRAALAAINSTDRAVNGVTGLNFFDENGDSDKPVAVARYFNKTPISGMTHFALVANTDEIANLEEEMKSGRITLINGRHMFRKSMVYTGVKLEKIGPYDSEKEQITLDFNLWFRYRGDIEPENIDFLNSVEPLSLGEAIHSEVHGSEHYSLYRVKGEFRTNFIPSRVPLGEHMAGFSFRHRSLNRNSLLYISDTVGMGLTGAESLYDKSVNGLIREQFEQWRIESVFAFEQAEAVDTLGMPAYLGLREGQIPFSEFVFATKLQQTNMTLRGSLPAAYSEQITFIAALILVVVLILRHLFPDSSLRTPLWVVMSMVMILLLISGEMWLIDTYLVDEESYIQEMVMKGIDTLWWLVPAILLIDAIEIFFWRVIERSTGRQIPGVVRGIIATIIYVMAAFGVVAFVFDQKLTGLMATSGLIAMIIGLAIQVNLSNIFSGIALNIEHPFRVGDWVKIGEHEGQVMDVTWRATRIQTKIKHLISIPNTPVADAAITNFSTYGFARLKFEIGIHPVHPPLAVKQSLLNALMSVPSVIHDPKAKTYFHGIINGTGLYVIIFSFSDYGNRNRVTEEVWLAISNHLQLSGFTFVTPLQRVALNRPEPIAMEEFDLPDILSRVKLFENFPEEIYHNLVPLAERRDLIARERLLEQDEKGEQLYIIAEGVLASLWRESDGQREIEIGRLTVADSVGGEALLLGKPHSTSVEAMTAATVYAFNRRDLSALLKREPDLLRQFHTAVRAQVGAIRLSADETLREKEVSSGVIGQLWQRMSLVAGKFGERRLFESRRNRSGRKGGRREGDSV
ncbi:MAG: ABC transporter substrate-binding protein [Gammaproteobacteria bacterium]|nr:ABC transporter substrate-binding protein [Gammaproteobacteria bacterium]